MGLRVLAVLVLQMFWICHVSAQILITISDNTGGLPVASCSANFTHSSGSTSIPYGSNEDYSITLTHDGSDNVKNRLRLDFSFFDLRAGDFLYIYDGADASAPLLVQAAGNQLLNKTIWSSGEMLHFRFTSSPSEQGFGWLAALQCVGVCDSFQAQIHTASGRLAFCPDEAFLQLSATASYASAIPTNPINFQYTWNFSGTVFTGSNISFATQGPGAYPFVLEVNDPQYNCTALYQGAARVATYPDFNGTQAQSDTVCAGENIFLSGKANMSRWAGFPVSREELSPIRSGLIYESSLNFDVFPVGAILSHASDIDGICLDLEHTNFGHVKIELQCPSGSSVVLKDFGLGGAHWGEPVIDNDAFPGRPYSYCFSSTAINARMSQTAFQRHDYEDAAGNYYIGEVFLPAGSYTPDQDLGAFVGCPLNGDWTLKVTDNNASSAGHIFGWSLLFQNSLYPENLIFTPMVMQHQWFDGATALPTNANGQASLSKNNPGNYPFTYRMVDDFGCSWDTTLVVQVLPLPKAEIVSEFELPLCEGDTTVLSVRYLEGNPQNWQYRWSMQGAILDGRTSDTLKVYMPANYGVWVTDAQTGCADLFEINLSVKNCDLIVPNVFTPNGDGINDLFEISNLENYPRSHIVIYNRTGKKVFEHHDYSGNWWNGDGAPQGTYYYVLTYTRLGKRKQTQGVITLLR